MIEATHARRPALSAAVPAHLTAGVATPDSPWCPDEDTRYSIIARRNVLTALWAGRLIGLEGSALTAYAVEVHRADFAVAGDSDIVAKVVLDLHRAGVPVRPTEVQARLKLFHREALRQTSATD